MSIKQPGDVGIPTEVRATFFVGSEGFIEIDTVVGSGQHPKVTVKGTFDSETLAVANIISEAMKCLSMGIELGVHFNPYHTSSDDDLVVRCRWQKSGILKLFGGTKRQYQHATTVEEAESRQRVFTCTMKVYRQLPKKKATRYATPITD